jgi:hypothetical protein
LLGKKKIKSFHSLSEINLIHPFSIHIYLSFLGCFDWFLGDAGDFWIIPICQKIDFLGVSRQSPPALTSQKLLTIYKSSSYS